MITLSMDSLKDSNARKTASLPKQTPGKITEFPKYLPNLQWSDLRETDTKTSYTVEGFSISSNPEYYNTNKEIIMSSQLNLLVRCVQCIQLY